MVEKVSRHWTARAGTWLMMAVLAASWIMDSAKQAAIAASLYDLRPPASAFVLFSPLEQPGRSPRAYGPSAPMPDWAIAQWNIPENLPPFQASISQNRFGAVHILPNGAYELRQTTMGLPCNKIFASGQRLPDEFDLFVQGLRPIALATESRAGRDALPPPSLGEAQAVRHSIDVEIGEARSLDRACPHTMANMLTAVVLANRVAKQTFFYQIYLGRFELRGQALTAIRASPAWFRTGRSAQSGGQGSFGYDDNIWTSYGLAPAMPGTKLHVAVDILPRLRALIAQGRRYGIDQDLSHWWISGTYHGQNAFGHISASSRWSGFGLVATMSH